MTGLGSVLSLQLSSNKHSNLDMPLDASSMICRHVLQIHAIQAFDPDSLVRMGNFADNHDEYSRLAYFCRYDSLRTHSDFRTPL